MLDRLRAEEALAQKGIFATTVDGVSMRPMLTGRRDTAVITPITAPLRKYDVVLFRRGEQLVLHRIVEIGEAQYTIRGDNCPGADRVCREQILGILTQFTRKGKQISVSAPGYLLYCRLWVASHPLRMALQGLKQRTKRIIK